VEKDRVQAFSDGVIAILITIMVLELRIPRGSDASDLRPLVPVFLTYLLSFVNLGIYWNNHHHLLSATRRVNGAVLWANLHLLFWLSLVPFATLWIGESGLAPLPTAMYGCVLLLAAIAYSILVRAILACQPPHSTLASLDFRQSCGRRPEGWATVSISPQRSSDWTPTGSPADSHAGISRAT